ncbi:MAG: PAS domain S-box protein [Spirochaetales bacterium]|uniref:histidine kinase n=1 Tax=Candidatus Thalassospirochaeta sargassi TaxID=3119039 RepID=A0AAJ1MIV8_9SPIO|nr:PAS domain S-box protein [Spirochaetales bacterium]
MKDLKAYTLLLAEADEEIANSNRLTLEGFGYRVETAPDAESVFKIAGAGNIDLILINTYLGGYEADGIQTASKLIDSYDIPLIFFTECTEPELIQKAEEINSYGYLEKDVSTQILNSTIKTAIRLAGEIRSGSNVRLMLNDVLNTIPIRVFWKDLDSVYLGCNRPFSEDSGLDVPEQIIGLTDFDIRDAEQAERNRADDRQIIDSGESRINYEELFQTKDGGKGWILTSKIPLRNHDSKMYGVLGMYENITERKLMEEEIIHQKNRLSNILFGSNVGTWEWNYQTGENTINEYWASILGYTLEELLEMENGTSWETHIHKDDAQKVYELMEQHRRGDSDFFEYEFRMKHKSGSWVWVLSRGKISSWTENGKPLIISGTHLDVTERKKAETELLNQLTEKETLLKEVHHRIKNNFASVVSLLSLQLESVETEDAREVIKDAIGRVNSMKVLYQKLLMVDDYENTSVEHYLGDLVDEIVAAFSEKTKIRIKKDLCDCRLNTRQLFKIGIIVNELITNVMKYSFEGKNGGSVEVIFRLEAGFAVLTVQDDGCGLPDDFDLQAEKGLGLFLIRILTNELKGTFSMESSGGLISTLRFPVSP